jgi:hypothetical protein
MATPWLDAIKKKLGLDKKKPQPVPAPSPAPKPAPGVIDYLKALKLFNASHLDKLGPAVGLSLLTLFFAISGLLAWIVVVLKFMLTLAR